MSKQAWPSFPNASDHTLDGTNRVSDKFQEATFVGLTSYGLTASFRGKIEASGCPNDPAARSGARSEEPNFAPSLDTYRKLPGILTQCSWRAGWRSLLLRAYEEPGTVEEFTTAPTPDQLIVLTTGDAIRSRSGISGGGVKRDMEWEVSG